MTLTVPSADADADARPMASTVLDAVAATFAAPLAVVPDESHAEAVVVEGAGVEAGGRVTLHPVHTTIGAGTLVAIAGGSGAGKTTLLEVMAGLRRPNTGQARLGRNGAPAVELAGTGRVGVVPQDDIIHRELPLRRTLLHAARLRPVPDGAPAAERVDAVMAGLGLTDRADVPVASLSGGQRKRASIAVELLTDPEILFLDEPTSGLDPVSAHEVIDTLRGLARQGIAVVMTTHHPAEIERCDRVLFLAGGGRLRFDGTPGDAKASFAVDDVEGLYEVVAAEDPSAWAPPHPPLASVPSHPGSGVTSRGQGSAISHQNPPSLGSGVTSRGQGSAISHQNREGRRGWIRQWAVLSARSTEVMVRNRLTLAILVGSPALVIAMMAVLFPAGPSTAAGPAQVGPAQVAFWMAFSAFFFGLTYGLLQIVTERAVLRRDRFAGLRVTAYLASKVAVLLPFLTVVSAALLGVLRALDRLPTADASTYAAMLVALGLASAAGLAIGLLASAAVADPAQATLALPMICFPQVLFGGAVVPVAGMTGVGEAISTAMVTRWAFESLGRTLGLGGPDGADAYTDAFSGSATDGWLALAAITGAALVGAWAVLRRPTRRT